ncbi:GntR family transcriptional regulator [Ruficoccus amylovorans]|uniref:GntR family transcriptional regulator n=1 Tax=Ruficoccus amylovorans TaxID=1804625 RepID=A0A842HD54_9BACT|nr:GntR family transcriptional regulator [Ruficoccus amylovorans]MBC2593474.1 GntR family transcriptional regulator [Ruficoccus amylovorans]
MTAIGSKIGFAKGCAPLMMPVMPAHTSANESVSSHLNRLVRLVFSEKYLPGDRLVERDLAAQLNLSRIPIREGLLMLAAKGLILKDDSSRGMRLRDYTPTEVLHLYEYREAIELAAIHAACQHRTQTQLVELELLCDELDAGAEHLDTTRRLELEWSFHQSIVLASGNARFISDFALLMVECNYVFYHLHSDGRNTDENANLSLSTHVHAVAKEHRDIVRMIGERDSASASTAMRAHLSSLSSRIHRILVKRPFRADTGD